MANKNLFKSLAGKLIPATNAVNEENAPAYRFTAKQALAQYAATGCMNQTFYASAEEQLKNVLALCSRWTRSSSHKRRYSAASADS